MIKNSSNQPKLSIIIPAYNKQRYIKQTLQSIVSQNYPNFEVLIYDPGSTDGTLETIEDQIRQDPKRFKLFYKQDNGQLDAINQGFAKASGKIVAYLNADDVYAPNAFQEVADSFLKNPTQQWLVGQCNIIDSQNKVISAFATSYKNFLLQRNSFLGLLLVNYMNQPAVFLTKKTFESEGPFTGSKNYILEYAMWLKLGQRAMPEVVPKILASFRLTKDTISTTQFTQLLLKDDYAAVQKYTKNPLLLVLHQLHNYVRIGLLKWI